MSFDRRQQWSNWGQGTKRTIEHLALVAVRIWFIMGSITPSSDRTYVVADPI
jgi:hypothetical protein